MQAYHLKFNQNIPISLSAAWDFFSSPLNLQKITPPEMAFKVTSGLKAEDKMYAGMIITYKVSPMLGIKMDWMTEITHVEHEQYFIDEQRFGPYQFWHHQHHFKEIPGGVEMNDILTYGMPVGIIGRAVNKIYVANKIQQIFNYRTKKVIELFGSI
ncbi:SRPBCC family protein [Pedobacter sp. MC2016-14]|uniref:SRPBCC family protein n=1 Tax=Pedobacter sp. MC2016-14 TaxID=2897327 RepID=UPI001E583C95|nr:SRPBCC family protein [Pedobacter sp. MC2016-14]MCD0490354.1 SRPBCC family protein [Pedobacter sp. MC2016-14]